jgi:hypothetical protein
MHKVTDENKRIVKMLAAVGVRHEDIAAKLDISSDTLVRKYKKELDEGRVDANAAVAQTLFQQAKAGNITAAIFWLKTRAQWKENHVIEHTGLDGGPIQTTLEVVGIAPKDRNS